MISNLIQFIATAAIIQPVALLGVGGGVGFWFGVGDVGGANRIVAAAILAVSAIAAIIWRYRDQARQRWQLVLNQYAEREIARSYRTRASASRR